MLENIIFIITLSFWYYYFTNIIKNRYEVRFLSRNLPVFFKLYPVTSYKESEGYIITTVILTQNEFKELESKFTFYKWKKL